MRFLFDTNYSANELACMERNQYKMVSELRLAKVAFTEKPLRMIQYGGTYVAEIEEEGERCWAVISKSRTGTYLYSSCYPDLQAMIDGL